MPTIRPILPHETGEAKQLIYTIAREIFHDDMPLEEMITSLEASHELGDMDDIQRNYFENGGTFLVMTEDGQIIGTGALRRFGDETCELKRFWFAIPYHGQGLSQQMIQTLLGIARELGYSKIRLGTDPTFQKRAINFYKKVGFQQISETADEDGDILMEMEL